MRPAYQAVIGPALSILLLLLSLSANLVEAQGSTGRTVPVERYWQQVDEALRTVQELEGADAEAIRTALGALASEFSAISEVELADGRQIPVDSSYLVTQFLKPEPDLVHLEALLTAVQASRNRWPDPNHDSQDLIPLAEILAQPEFQSAEDEPGPLQQLRQRIVDSLLDLLFRIYPQSAGGLGPLIRAALTVVGIIALFAALVFTIRGLLRDIVADEESLATGDDGLAMVNADQALEQAHRYSRSGDYRSAVRYLYISSLLLLEERDLLRYDRTQTNQEYLRSVAGRPELAEVLRDVIDVFDRVWYGFQSLDDQAFSHYAGRVEQLRQQS